MSKPTKKIPSYMGVVLAACLSALGQGSGYNAAQLTTFSIVSVGTTVPESSLIGYHQIFWTDIGTVSACTVSVDTSPDGVTWTVGGGIGNQTCTSNGSSSVTAFNANYIRINVQALSGGGTTTIQYEGWAYNPSGGGISTPVSIANGGTSTGTASANTVLNATSTTAATWTATPTLGSNGGTAGQITFNGATSGNCAVGPNATSADFGVNCPVLLADSSGYYFSQSASVTGNAGAAITVIGTGTTEAFSTSGGTSTHLINMSKCAVVTAVNMTVSGTAVTYCTFTLPNVAATWAWQCSGTYSVTTSSDTFAVGWTIAQAPTSVTGNGSVGSVTASAGNTQVYSTGSATSAATTNQTMATSISVSTVTSVPFTTSGIINTTSVTSGTFLLTGLLTGTSPSGTINPGTTCLLY